MQIPNKDNQKHTFEAGMDSDSAPEVVLPNTARTMLNCRPYTLGDKGIVTNIKGNTLIPNDLPNGNNIGLGWGKNEETGKFYYFNYNDNGYHGIYAYDIITQAVTPVLLNLTDTNGADILKFDPKWLINHVDIVTDKLIYWVDGLNKARKFNILKAIDKSVTGYGTVITEDFITAYKQTGVFAPTVIYFTDLTRTSNYLYALQFKFAYRYYYDDGEISNTSDFSAVALPPNESYLGSQSITFDNNGINVTLPTGNKLVVKIEVLVKINSADWVSCIILNKSLLSIPDYGVYTFPFYNDGAYTTVDNIKVLRPYSFLPHVPYVQSFVKVAMTYGNAAEGFETVKIAATVANTFTPFYLPSGTISQLNNPILTATLLSATEHGGAFNSWWTTVTHFEVGSDVKKGNYFQLIARGGSTSPSNQENFGYTANIGDSAATVAAQIKTYLRLIDAVATGVISNESTDGSGNVSWDFTIEAHESQQPIEFTPSVTAVNYSTLLDNGLSINTIKQGASRKYGIVYDDDDGRTSLTYTVDSLLIYTPFETETLLGQTVPIGLQQPIHTITINSKPPIWAKYWRLVRTSDTNTFIQLLIQQVSTVVVANEGTYLDLVVGSLFTYQRIHPDTILKYDFERGDRLRLISNENSQPPVLYTPFFETEVLSYSVDQEQFINANITTTIGTPSVNVTPSDGPKTDFIGKSIIIQDAERTIVGVSGTDYILDEPLTLEQSSTVQTYVVPNYTIVDKRGILRIKKPPAGYNVVNQSLIEIYRPQQNLDNQSYLNFYDFQLKFAINNWGTDQAAHVGNIQNQNGATSCIVQTTNGDAYVRNRELPSNNSNPNPQVIIDQICDPNFSDFYQSNLYNTGRVYPQDQSYGVVKFGSRVRFSNNYIQDTQINGLNDFDNDDRKDYNDPYGDINLSRFRKNFLYLFEALRTAWTPIFQNIITDNNNNPVLATTDKLLNDLQYSVWEGGIGKNGSGWFENGDYQYIPSANSGVFLRIAQDGSIPISSLYSFDKRTRDLLSFVSKYSLNIYGGSDRVNDEALFTIPDFIQYIYNNGFNAGDWQSVLDAYPDGTTFAVTQQPANSTATVVGNQIQITGTSTLGNDFFKFQGTLPDSSTTPVMNFCFTVVEVQNRQVAFRIESDTAYCEQVDNTPPSDTTDLTPSFYLAMAFEGHLTFSVGEILSTDCAITYDLDYIQNGNTYNAVTGGVTTIVTGATVTPDNPILIVDHGGTITDVIITFTPSPNPNGSVNINYTSPITIPI